jgi:tetratricopeptide (TPR) repeat protein
VTVSREFAREKLAADPAAQQVQRRFAAYFSDLAEQACDDCCGPHATAWFTRLEREHNNLRTVLQWALDRGDIDLVARISGALRFFWHECGHINEAARWLAIALPHTADPALLLRLLHGVALLQLQQGKAHDSNATFREYESLARRERSPIHRVNALLGIGLAMIDLSAYEEAEQLLEQALILSRSSRNDVGEFSALNNLSIVAHELAQYTRARSYLRESLTIARRIQLSDGMAASLENLARVAVAEHDYQQALTLYLEALQIATHDGLVTVATECFAGLAAVLVLLGQPEHAAVLWGAHEARQSAVGVDSGPRESARREQLIAEARAALGEQQYGAALEAGRSMTLERAVAYALHHA